MASFATFLLIWLTIFIYGQEIAGSVPDDSITREAPLRSVIDHYLSIRKGLHAQGTRARNLTRITKPSRSVFSNFVNQLINLNNTSDIYKPVATDQTLQDEQQQTSDPSSPIQSGLSNFLVVLSNISNRPLSDQSANSSSGGIVSGGIAAFQETVSQVSSSIQSGINSVFGSNQPNEASVSAGWNPVRPISSAISVSSQPSFCPADCTMVCGLSPESASSRIVGGTDVTPPNRYPWIAMLQYYGQNTGTGTLINDRVVLTSGAIISKMVVFKQIKVLFGVYDPNAIAEGSSVKTFSVTRTKLHPQYTANNPFRDNIGLLQLAVPVTITDTFMPICLPNTVDSFSGADALLAGWGARELGGESWNSLQAVTIPLYSVDECRLAYPNATENNLCGGIFGPAAKEQHKTSCDGDEGAGLMYPWRNDPSFTTLIGIALQIPGVGCGRTNEPAIFTKLHAYIPWVRSQSAGCYCKA